MHPARWHTAARVRTPLSGDGAVASLAPRPSRDTSTAPFMPLELWTELPYGGQKTPFLAPPFPERLLGVHLPGDLIRLFKTLCEHAGETARSLQINFGRTFGTVIFRHGLSHYAPFLSGLPGKLHRGSS